jgi:hypothetical protein
VRRRAILPEICHADAVERRTDHEVHIVHDHWTVNRHRQRLFAFVELPPIDLVGTVVKLRSSATARNADTTFRSSCAISEW